MKIFSPRAKNFDNLSSGRRVLALAYCVVNEVLLDDELFDTAARDIMGGDYQKQLKLGEIVAQLEINK